MAHQSSAPHSFAPTKILGPEASGVSFERIARFPEPGWHTPRKVSFSPDGGLITFLQSESFSDEMALFGFDAKTQRCEVLLRAKDLAAHDRPLSREEELRRERKRERILGISDYRWAKSANVMVIPFGGNLYLYEPRGRIEKLTDGGAPALDPKLSDDGTKLAFVRNGELVLLDLATKKETPLTHGAPEGVTRGLSDFISQEEFSEESGFFWSPTGGHLAYLEVDERDVDIVPVLGYRGDQPDLMQQRYPKTGTRNPKVTAGILDLATRHTTFLKLPHAGEHYLGRFVFGDEGRALFFQAMTRDQHRVVVLRADVKTGAVQELWTQTSETWVEFIKMKVLEREGRIVATVVVNGHNHLEVRSASTGQRLVSLTSGDWDVESIVDVDEDESTVSFIANLVGPLERRLSRVPLDGGVVETLSTERGVHAVAIGKARTLMVDEHSARDRMPKAVVRGKDLQPLVELPVHRDPDLDSLGIRIPDIIELRRPASPTLYGALLKPRNMEPGRRYPVVVMVYGGPGVQMIHDAWAPRLLWQHLADRGFVVFQLDNRGSAGRGPAFQAPIYGHLGRVELEDQKAGVDALAAMPFVDDRRIGIYGHSYGGFMAIEAMLRAPGTFKVGVAGAPVTDFRLYDTGYTERYMGTPQNNAAGYDEADLATSAKNLRGKLFVIHALMDENVHFSHTAHITDALVAAGKPFDLFVFPGERHGYRHPKVRAYAMSRVVEYFAEHL